MRRPYALAAFASLAAILCCNLEGEPDDLFFFHGLVTDTAGTPKPGHSVLVQRGFASGNGCPDSLYETASSSFFEYKYIPPSTTIVRPYTDAGLAFAPYRTIAADDHGRYIAELMRYEVTPPLQQQGAGPSCVAMSATGASGNTSTAVVVAGFQLADHKYPDLTIWDGVQLAAASTASGLQFVAPPLPWEPSPPDGGPAWVNGPFGTTSWSGSGRYYVWQVGRGTQAAWRERTYGGALVVTPQMLEDFADLSVWLESLSYTSTSPQGALPVQLGSEDAYTISQTASASMSTGAVIPKSRGCSCTIDDVPEPGCPLTDGQLVLTGPGISAFGGNLAWQIDLGSAAMPTLAIIRDLQYGTLFGTEILVEGSMSGVVDGGTWRTLGRGQPQETSDGGPDFPDGPPPGGYERMASGLFIQIALDAGSQPVRHVRFTSPSSTSSGLGAAREVSIFE